MDNKDKKFDSQNSFNLSDDLNKIINAKIEENEANSIEDAISKAPDEEQLDKIGAEIDAQIEAKINDKLSENRESEKSNQKKKRNTSNKNTNSEEEKKRKKNIILVILIILLVVIGSIFLGRYIYDQINANKDGDELDGIKQTTSASDPNTQAAQNPYDIESLQAKNSDIYAWIKVPNTNVDYPVVQSQTEDNYYLKRSALTKEWQSSGAIYTQRVNSLDFSDPLTVVYGHNGYKDSMFTTLHKFENPDFFNKNEYFYIYTQDSKLTYQIVSAFKFDDRHLMYAYNMQDLNSRKEFLNMIQNPESQKKNVRDIGRKLTIDDKICVLSTCITNQKSNRYLVCGVLVNNEKTN